MTHDSVSNDQQGYVNTDREIWREREGDYYADSIHVTEGGGIGINCGGNVFVKPVREWHRLAALAAALPTPPSGDREAVLEETLRELFESGVISSEELSRLNRGIGTATRSGRAITAARTALKHKDAKS